GLKHEGVVVARAGPVRPVGPARHGGEVAVHPVVTFGFRGAMAGGAARLQQRSHALGVAVVAPGLAQLLGGSVGARGPQPEERGRQRSCWSLYGWHDRHMGLLLISEAECFARKLVGCGLPPGPPTRWQVTQLDAAPWS